MPRLFELLSDGAEKKLRSQARPAVSKRESGRQQQHKTIVRPELRTAPSFSMPDFVALDLETTGLDHKGDRIIEIGAVRFIGGTPTDEYRTFVNPGISIPPVISNLTGISNADVENAPLFSAVAETLIAFLGDLPIAGHQVEFDTNFLNEELKRMNRPAVRNQSLDTAVIARTALPGINGYSLGKVASCLGIELKNAHRALDDARSSGFVAVRLIPELLAIPPRTRRLMAHVCPTSLIKGLLYKGLDRNEDLPPPPSLPKQEMRPALTKPQKLQNIEIEEVKDCFSTSGFLASQFEKYIPRPSQILMAQGVASALNQQDCLAAEAGTGVGKSLAYLVPASMYALKNNLRILVSTHTRNTGDQLFLRDMPVISRMLGEGLRYSVLKGRGNYLCPRNWGRLISGDTGSLSPRDRFALLPLIRWAEETTTGDIEEQSQFNRKWFPRVWNLVSAEISDCPKWRCPQASRCFLLRARAQALSSHIVIINHSLFFSELCSQSSFLGGIGSVIFDEAHHLEACGHRHLRVELDSHRFTRFFELCENFLHGIQRQPAAFESAQVSALKAIVKRVRRDGQDFLNTAGVIASAAARPDADGFWQAAIRDMPFAQHPSQGAFVIALGELQDIVRDIRNDMGQAGAPEGGLASDVISLQERTSQLKADVGYVSAARTEGHVFWAEGSVRRGWVKLCGVPLDIGEVLASVWERQEGAVICTSATLSVAGSMDFFLEKAGLRGSVRERTHSETFESPFAHSQRLLAGVDTALEPDAPGYTDYIANSVASLIGEFGKNIMVLFTSNAMLADVYQRLVNRPDLPQGCQILSQHMAASRQNVFEQFKNSRGSVLLGADSFWEGVDAPGESCEIVVVPRLPFAVPSHPLTQALAARYEELYGDSFMSYSLPEAIIRFRQGAGRLIRTQQDRGLFVVLDNRIVRKRYAHAFRRSLEGEFELFECFADMQRAARKFFGF